MSRVAVTSLLITAMSAVWLVPVPAAAGGLEYTAAGATALGRGGAVTARADDPMVLSYNPAGLAELRGNQLLFDFNIAQMSACVDPIGYYGWGAYAGGNPTSIQNPKTGQRTTIPLGQPPASASATAYYNYPLDTVCMQQHVQPVPQLIFTSRLSEKLGFGAGLVFPSITPEGKWGGDNGIIKSASGNYYPAATRYMLLNTGNLGVFPTIGLGYRVTDWLRIGASFEWGIIWVDTTTMATVGPGTSPNADIIAHIRGRDLFVPALNASVHLVPMDSLDIVGAFRYQDPIHAPGKLDTLTGEFDPALIPHTTHDIKVDSINQNMPWKIRGGIRYSSRLAPRPTGDGQGEQNKTGVIHDAMQDERWDVELDAEYQLNARNKAQVINYAPNQVVEFEQLDHSISSSQFPDPTQPNTTIDKRWKNQISLRAGGSYNIVPGVFSVMAGAHYETRGVDPSYMQVDFWPVQRIGLHGGLTIRIAGTTDIVFSYAHIFDENIVVGAPPNLPRDQISMNTPAGVSPANIDKSVGIAGRGPLPPLEEQNPPSNPDGVAKLRQVTTKLPAGQPVWIINSGTYRSAIDVVAVGVHGHF